MCEPTAWRTLRSRVIVLIRVQQSGFSHSLFSVSIGSPSISDLQKGAGGRLCGISITVVQLQISLPDLHVKVVKSNLWRLRAQRSTQLTRGTCDNIGGYFTSDTDVTIPTTPAPRTSTWTYRTTTTTYQTWYLPTTTTTPATRADPIPRDGTTTGRCFYYDFDCPGYTYRRQCYSNRSSAMSCPTCENIGGSFAANDGCYYESSNCSHFSVGGQCHTNKYCNGFLNNSSALIFASFYYRTNKKI